jgi:hypothetical protein
MTNTEPGDDRDTWAARLAELREAAENADPHPRELLHWLSAEDSEETPEGQV